MEPFHLANDRLGFYLDRVGLGERPPPDAAGLARIQAAHQQGIGFENLDICLGRAIAIDGETVFEKLVQRGRGGYCFEKNRLFRDVLAALGVPIRPLLARVLLEQARDALPPETHVCLLARIEGRDWIADAGFGGSTVPPMLLEDRFEARTADGARHRLRRVGETGALPGEWLLERAAPAGAGDGRVADAEWQPQYAFGLRAVAAADLAMANHWTATRAGTRFTSLHVVSIGLPDGFASMIDRELSISRIGTSERRMIEYPEEYAQIAWDLFRIALSEADAAALPLFASDAVSAP